MTADVTRQVLRGSGPEGQVPSGVDMRSYAEQVIEQVQARLWTLLRTTATVCIAALGTAAIGSLWFTDVGPLTFLMWVVGFLILGSVVALVSPLRLAGFVLGVAGAAVGAWIEMQLTSGSSLVGSAIAMATAAAGIPASVGFFLIARHLGWLGSGAYRDANVAYLSHALPPGFPGDTVGERSPGHDGIHV